MNWVYSSRSRTSGSERGQWSSRASARVARLATCSHANHRNEAVLSASALLGSTPVGSPRAASTGLEWPRRSNRASSQKIDISPRISNTATTHELQPLCRLQRRLRCAWPLLRVFVAWRGAAVCTFTGAPHRSALLRTRSKFRRLGAQSQVVDDRRVQQGRDCSKRGWRTNPRLTFALPCPALVPQLGLVLVFCTFIDRI